MNDNNKTEKNSDADQAVKIMQEAEEVRNFIKKKEIQNNILKKLIGNISKSTDSNNGKSNQ